MVGTYCECKYELIDRHMKLSPKAFIVCWRFLIALMFFLHMHSQILSCTTRHYFLMIFTIHFFWHWSILLPIINRLDTTISASSKQDSGEGSRLFKIMAKSFSKRWQSGEITNFQYLMHLNTLAGRGYSDLTQYPVFPWVLADYESDTLDLRNPQTFRKLDKPMGCQTEGGEEEFRKRFVHLTSMDILILFIS